MTPDVAGPRPCLRRWALVAVLGLVIAALAACGGGGGGGDGGRGDNAGAEPAEGSAAPDDDRRVVVLAEEFVLADVLELGIRPIASTASVVESGFQGLDDYDTSDIEVLPMTTLSMERLASLQPDVLVTLQFWADQAGEDVLRGMGELLIVPDGLTVSERLTVLGDLLDRPDEAAAVVAELDEATEQAREAVPDDCEVSLAAIYPGPSPAVFVAGPWDLPTSVLSTGCALNPDPSVAEPDENGRVYLSLEEIGMLDAPKLVLLQSDTVEGEQQAVDDIEANPLWSGLPAVRSGDVVTFDRLGYPGARGQIRFLDDFAALFA
jgi:iron complex transport system substrate-binding protein